MVTYLYLQTVARFPATSMKAPKQGTRKNPVEN